MASRNSSADHLARVRRICLALPDSSEKTAWQTPTFRAHGRLFAMFADNHHGDGRMALWLAAPTGAQQLLVESDPERFFVPPYVGKGGWVGVCVDRCDDALIERCVRDAWGVIAERAAMRAPRGRRPVPGTPAPRRTVRKPAARKRAARRRA